MVSSLSASRARAPRSASPSRAAAAPVASRARERSVLWVVGGVGGRGARSSQQHLCSRRRSQHRSHYHLHYDHTRIHTRIHITIHTTIHTTIHSPFILHAWNSRAQASVSPDAFRCLAARHPHARRRTLLSARREMRRAQTESSRAVSKGPRGGRPSLARCPGGIARALIERRRQRQ